jgi:hypothetical protein
MSQYSRSWKITKDQDTPTGIQQRYTGLYIGIIKEVVDGLGMGRLRVWMPDMGTTEDDKDSWITVGYCSPFFGSTDVTDNKTTETYESTQTSYGMWFVPPDINNRVLIGFVGGNKSQGYWLGVIPPQYATRMVPSVAAGNAYTNVGKSDTTLVPVPQAEYNKKQSNPQQVSVTEKDDANYLRPYAKYHAEGLIKQGLIQDQIRGVDFSSARRSINNNTSEVYGILTPGPKIDNTPNQSRRKGGSTFVMDDNDGTEKIRLRTRSGSQFLLDESNGIVYVVNRDGTSWVEMDAEGNIDMFAQGSVTIRSEQDVNIRADKNIRMEAGQNIYIKAAKDHDGTQIVGQDSGVGGDIYIEARNDVNSFVKNNAKLTVAEGALDINVATTTKFKSGGDIDFKSGAVIRQESAGEFNLVAGGDYRVQSNSIGLTSSNIDLSLSGAMRVSSTSTAGGIMYAPNFKSPSVGLNEHIHVHNVWAGPTSHSNDMKPPTDGGGSGTASGPGATAAQDSELVTEEPTVEKTNIENQDIGLPNIKTAIQNLIDKVRETKIKTLLPRWVTREPSPEKKRS